MKTSLSILLMVLITSCNSKKILFSSVKKSELKTEKLEIYEDYTYCIFLNDNVIKKGTAKLFEDKRLLLSDEPKNYNQSLIQSKEFLINGDSLCELVFEKNSDSTTIELRVPQRVIKETDCYIITQNFN